MRRTHVQMIGALAAVAIVSACGGSSGGDGVPQTGNSDSKGGSTAAAYTVKFGSVGGLTDAGVYIADARGYFKDENLTVERSRMQGGSPLTAAIATGDLDVAGISVSAGLFNAVNQGINLRIVGDKQSIRPGVSATHFVAQKKFQGADEAETLHNLRGKTVAVSDKTSATTAIVDFLFHEYGMSIKDVNLKVLGYSEITAALLNDSVDAAVELEPFLTKVLASGHVIDVSDESEVMPPGGATLVPLVYSQNFIEEHNDAAKRFMVAYMKGVRDYNEAMLHAKDKAEIISIIAKGSGSSEETVKNAHVAGLDPNQHVDVDYLSKLEKWFQQEGYVKTYVDPAKMVDSSFAEYAVSKLGQYTNS